MVLVTFVPYLIVSAVHLINFRQRLKTLNQGIILPTLALIVLYALLFTPYLAKLDQSSIKLLLDDAGNLAVIILVLDLAAILWALRQALRADDPSTPLPPQAP